MNEKLRKALETGEYTCPECGEPMIFDDEERKDSLVCENCSYSCYLDEYGDDPDEVERRRITGVAGTSSTESYEEVYDDEDDD